MAELWVVDPNTLVRPTVANPTEAQLAIGSTPLIDLGELQELIRSGELIADDVWPATRKVENNLEDLAWTYGAVLDCIVELTPEDHKSAEWCQVRDGEFYPCDAYVIRYDHVAKQRLRQGEMNYYVKFSLGDNGGLMLVLVSCHL